MDLVPSLESLRTLPSWEWSLQVSRPLCEATWSVTRSCVGCYVKLRLDGSTGGGRGWRTGRGRKREMIGVPAEEGREGKLIWSSHLAKEGGKAGGRSTGRGGLSGTPPLCLQGAQRRVAFMTTSACLAQEVWTSPTSSRRGPATMHPRLSQPSCISLGRAHLLTQTPAACQYASAFVNLPCLPPLLHPRLLFSKSPCSLQSS